MELQTTAYLTVTELNNQIKSLLENTFARVFVEGEISNITHHASGHTYFSIKDRDSTIRCTLFKGNAQRVKFRLENGLSIMIEGALSVYAPRGEYQVNCISITPSGIGSLALAFDQLKKKLEAKGYFDRSTKKALPRFPKHIAIVTSGTGAAIQDMLRVAQKRWPLVKITLIDTLVQGVGAKEDIAKNIAFADTLGADVIIAGRGGGSIEDLWAFNEEVVAEAIFRAKTPIVSAVGHESDVLISDFVADMRAPTPSAAIEMILPDSNEMLMLLDSIREELTRTVSKILQKKELLLNELKESFKRHSFENMLANYQKEIELLRARYTQNMSFFLKNRELESGELTKALNYALQNLINQKSTELMSFQKAYENNDPKKRTKRGFAEVAKGEKVIALSDLADGDEFELTDAETRLLAKVLKSHAHA